MGSGSDKPRRDPGNGRGVLGGGARVVQGLCLPLDDVVVVFACNDSYAPYTSVAIQSLIEHVSDDRRYDIVVLSNGISAVNQGILRDQVRTRPNCDIGFVDASGMLDSLKLPVHGHFRPETYMRLFVPEFLAPLEKAVYLDCDLVALADVAKLFDTDVRGCLLAATQDADTIGQAFGYNQTTMPYLERTLGLESPLDYFQAGVLLLNLEEFRSSFTTDEMVEIACSRHWQWLDQDALNVLAKGRSLRVDMAWNLLFDWEKIRRRRIVGSAPDEVRRAYEAARRNPYIVHFAGPDGRPWLYPDVDMGDVWWGYARRCPYREEIERRLQASHRTVRGRLKRLQVFCLYRLGMDLYDLLFPPKRLRRTATIRAFKAVGGHLI